MKKTQLPVVDKLLLDVIEYAFVEWLVRRGIFTAFWGDYDCSLTTRKTFRDCLRDHIRYAYCQPNLGPAALLDSAFLFDSTPEGYEFWINHSDAWRSFYDKL
jgi:hypothetical protein